MIMYRIDYRTKGEQEWKWYLGIVVLSLVQARDYSDIYFKVRTYLLIECRIDEKGKSKMTVRILLWKQVNGSVASLDGENRKEQIWRLLFWDAYRQPNGDFKLTLRREIGTESINWKPAIYRWCFNSWSESEWRARSSYEYPELWVLLYSTV